MAMKGCELFVARNTSLILRTGSGGKRVPKVLSSRACKANIGLPDRRWQLEMSLNCGKTLAILVNSNRERASAIQLSWEDSQVGRMSMLSNVVKRKVPGASLWLVHVLFLS